jgi:hypothetical protein
MPVVVSPHTDNQVGLFLYPRTLPRSKAEDVKEPEQASAEAGPSTGDNEVEETEVDEGE